MRLACAILLLLAAPAFGTIIINGYTPERHDIGNSATVCHEGSNASPCALAGV